MLDCLAHRVLAKPFFTRKDLARLEGATHAGIRRRFQSGDSPCSVVIATASYSLPRRSSSGSNTDLPAERRPPDMAQKCEGPRSNAGRPTKPVTSHDSPVTQATATSIWEIVERDGRVRLADLRAKCRDWATRRVLAQTLRSLAALGILRLAGSADGSTIAFRPTGATGGGR